MIDRANTTPPSVALLALGAAQAGGVLLLHSHLRRLAARPRVAAALDRAGALAVFAYLWHVTAMLLVALAVVLPGNWPTPPVASSGWWALRPAWVLVSAAAAAALLVLAARARRLLSRRTSDRGRTPQPRAARAWRQPWRP